MPALDAPPDRLYNALGDTVNVAAGLQTHAGPAGVVVGPATARELAHRFELEAARGARAEGQVRASRAFRVVRESTASRRAKPLVGLSPSWRRSTRRSPAWRTASARSSRSPARQESGRAGLSRRCAPTQGRRSVPRRERNLVHDRVSVLPLARPRAELARPRRLGARGEAAPRAQGRGRRRAERTGRGGLSVSRLRAGCAALDGPDAERLRDLSRDSVQRQTFEAVATLFEALARERPLCLVFEDLHWADESTLQLIEGSSVSPTGTRLRSCSSIAASASTALASGRARAAALPAQTRRALHPLAPVDSKLLAGRAAGAGLPDEVSELLAATLWRESLFLEEALRDPVERGVLQPIQHTGSSRSRLTS